MSHHSFLNDKMGDFTYKQNHNKHQTFPQIFIEFKLSIKEKFIEYKLDYNSLPNMFSSCITNDNKIKIL